LYIKFYSQNLKARSHLEAPYIECTIICNGY